MLISLLLSLAMASGAPEANPADSRIVNGKDITGNAFPAAVALGFTMRHQNVQFCSASLITPRLVLTAGHCTRELAEQYGVPEDQLTQYMHVFFGDDVNGANVKSVGVIAAHVDPDYTSNAQTGSVDNDINVLELDQDVDWVEPVWFRETPVGNKAVGDDVTSVGYGITSSANQNSNGIKRDATLVLTKVAPDFIYSNYATNPGHTNICSGDSGGPQYATVHGHLEQWGVHSFGFGNDPNTDLCFQQSGSTNVGTYAKFVWEQVRAVHGDDYIPKFSTWDYCDEKNMYGDAHCDPKCAKPDIDCAMDTNGDGDVSAAESSSYEASHPDPIKDGLVAKGCDETGGLSTRFATVIGALALLRRRRR